MDISKMLKNDNEKPLDNLVSDGGFCSILRTVVCVGDSLSSGEFEIKVENNEACCSAENVVACNEQTLFQDMFDYSWGQFMARMAGIKVYNYSRGGMTAKEYCESFAESKGFWNEDVKANAYIIALGVNDVNRIRSNLLSYGDVSDINLENCEKNGDSFIGHYAKIIQRYKKISPNAKFFLVTPPVVDKFKEHYERVSESLYRLSESFSHTFVLDIQKYGPDYNDSAFKEAFYLNGHLTPSGYVLTAKMICSYIDYIIRNNPKEFKLLGFQNTPLYTETLEKNNL